MGAITILGTVVLSFVFLAAGALKLSNRADTAKNLIEFGLPEQFAGPGSVVLPIAEMGTGLALCPAATARWGAGVALILLAMFTCAIGWNLFNGRKPECRCFGQVGVKPVGQSTLIRNGVLAAIAGFLLLMREPATSLTELVSRTDLQDAAIISLLVVSAGTLLIGGWTVIGLMQQQGRLLLRLEALERAMGNQVAPQGNARAHEVQHAGLPIGTKAPDFALPCLSRESPTSLRDLLGRGKHVLLIFSDPHCGPCNQLMPAVARWQRELSGQVTVALISRGDRSANADKARALGLQDVLLQAEDEVAAKFEVFGTPTAILIGSDGLVLLPAASGSSQIEHLLERACGNTRLTPLAMLPGAVPPARVAQLGEPAPEFRLPSVTGGSVRLGEKVGNKLLLLFWNPKCGFCSQMLGPLKEWEQSRRALQPELLLISNGTPQENRDMGLASEILLDQYFDVGTRYGATGTPSAVLIDERGTIASGLGIGAEAIFNLINANHEERAIA